MYRMARSIGDSLSNRRSMCGTISCSSAALRSCTPRSRFSTNLASVLSKPSSERASSSGSPPESCQAYSACSAISREWRLAVFMQALAQLGHLDGDAHRLGALVEPRARLVLVVGGEDAVGDRQARFER